MMALGPEGVQGMIPQPQQAQVHVVRPEQHAPLVVGRDRQNVMAADSPGQRRRMKQPVRQVVGLHLIWSLIHQHRLMTRASTHSSSCVRPYHSWKVRAHVVTPLPRVCGPRRRRGEEVRQRVQICNLFKRNEHKMRSRG
jgi:hypothetical protein